MKVELRFVGTEWDVILDDGERMVAVPVVAGDDDSEEAIQFVFGSTWRLPGLHVNRVPYGGEAVVVRRGGAWWPEPHRYYSRVRRADKGYGHDAISDAARDKLGTWLVTAAGLIAATDSYATVIAAAKRKRAADRVAFLTERIDTLRDRRAMAIAELDAEIDEHEAMLAEAQRDARPEANPHV